MRAWVVIAVPVVASLAYAQTFTKGASPVAAGADASVNNCASCHRAIVDEWQQSRHAAAWTNGLFQTEWKRLPRPWCVNCHAPLVEQQQDLSSALAAEGINCAVCHIRDGQMHAHHKRDTSPHNTMADNEFGSPVWCGGCHEFSFPRFDQAGAFASHTSLPMQATVTEYQQGPFASSPMGCMTCHNSAQGHAFVGAHDIGMLRRAVQLDVCRVGDGIRDARLRVTVTNSGAGHVVPTGDVHRHMALRAWRSAEPERLFQAYLGRKFQGVASGGNRVVDDTRVGPGQHRSYTIDTKELGDDAGGDVNVELRYVYSLDETITAGHDPGEPTWAIISSSSMVVEKFARCR